MVVQSHVTHERLLQIFTAGESVCLEHVSDTPVEALDHAIGARRAVGISKMIRRANNAIGTTTELVKTLIDLVIDVDKLNIDQTSIRNVNSCHYC